MEEVDWTDVAADPYAAAVAAPWVARVLALAEDVVAVALPVLSRPQVRRGAGAGAAARVGS